MYKWTELPDQTRVWVYQADRKLTSEEQQLILKTSEEFITAWTAHGASLRASAEIFHDLFLVIFVDEEHAKATGCSIDKSVHFVQALGEELKVNFMDRLSVAFRDGEEVKLCSMQDFEQMLKEGDASPDTIVFNNVVASIGDFKAHWELPVKESWHSRLIP